MNTQIISQPRYMYTFINRCGQLGWSNNNTLRAMKWKDHTFWGTWIDCDLAALSGVQHLPEIGDYTYRLLFRGAQLPEYNKYFSTPSRYHFNSIPFYDHIIPQMDHCPSQSDFVITTNMINDSSGHMHRTHRVMQLLAKQGLVTLLRNEILYNTIQSVWTLNVDCYLEKRYYANMERSPLFVHNS